MSEISVNKITTNTTQKLTIESGVVIGQESTGQFQVTDFGAIKFLGPLLLGTQTGNTSGGSFQMVSSSGNPLEPARWQTFRFNCPTISTGIPVNAIFTYLVEGYYEGCPENTAELPTPPTGFLYCDGSNGTPDLRNYTNPNIGSRSFEGGCNTSTPFNGTWTLTYIIKI
jgi:hypothetical protein